LKLYMEHGRILHKLFPIIQWNSNSYVFITKGAFGFSLLAIHW
jgi:hypothetical protein